MHVVNPKRDRIGDRPCHPNLSALPESPDCVVICVPREFAADHADRLAELDVNPLICSADRIVAVDALIALRPPTH